MLLSERRGNFTSYTVNGDDNRIKSLEEQISQQEVSAVLIIYANFFYIYINFSSHYLLFNSLSISITLLLLIIFYRYLLMRLVTNLNIIILIFYEKKFIMTGKFLHLSKKKILFIHLEIIL